MCFLEDIVTSFLYQAFKQCFGSSSLVQLSLNNKERTWLAFDAGSHVIPWGSSLQTSAMKPSKIGFDKVSCITILFSLFLLELAILESLSAFRLFSRGMCLSLTNLNLQMVYLTRHKYLCIFWPIALYSLFIWEITTFKSDLSSISWVPISATCWSLARHALYLDWLFVFSKLKQMETSILMTSYFFNKTLAPHPLTWCTQSIDGMIMVFRIPSLSRCLPEPEP